MPREYDDLQPGDRVRYIGDTMHKGKIATVVIKTANNIYWKSNQYADDYVPIIFDMGGDYGAYRKWLERIQETPSWEV